MATAAMIWLNRLFVRDAAATGQSMTTDRKPMEIEVERLPDHLWRALGFAPTRRPGGE